MRHLAIIAGLFAAQAALAQQPSEDEIGALNEIFACLAPGLPENWGRAHVVMTLSAPGSGSGNIKYMVAPLGAPDKIEPFEPCDHELPARILIRLRDYQPRERSGWTAMQLEFMKSGNFRINYEYPKDAKPPAEREKK